MNNKSKINGFDNFPEQGSIEEGYSDEKQNVITQRFYWIFQTLFLQDD